MLGLNTLIVSSWNELSSITWWEYLKFFLMELHKGSPRLPPTKVFLYFFFKIPPISLVVVDFPFVPVIAIIFSSLKLS